MNEMNEAQDEKDAREDGSCSKLRGMLKDGEKEEGKGMSFESRLKSAIDREEESLRGYHAEVIRDAGVKLLLGLAVVGMIAYGGCKMYNNFASKLPKFENTGERK